MVDIKVFWFIEHTSLLNLKPMNSADFEEGHIEDLVFMFSFGKNHPTLFSVKIEICLVRMIKMINNTHS